MDVKNYAPVCGIYCGNCDFLGNKCEGCGVLEGRPFWTSMLPSGVCPIHDCCSNRNKLEHCGLCDDFPCDTFIELRDPQMSDEEYRASLEGRQNELITRAEIGTDKWLSEKSLE